MSVANSASVVGERESLLSLGLPWTVLSAAYGEAALATSYE